MKFFLVMLSLAVGLLFSPPSSYSGEYYIVAEKHLDDGWTTTAYLRNDNNEFGFCSADRDYAFENDDLSLNLGFLLAEKMFNAVIILLKGPDKRNKIPSQYDAYITIDDGVRWVVKGEKIDADHLSLGFYLPYEPTLVEELMKGKLVEFHLTTVNLWFKFDLKGSKKSLQELLACGLAGLEFKPNTP